MSYTDLSHIRRVYPRKLIYARPEELDMVTSMDVQLHDQVVKADSCAYDHDLKNTWVTMSRWNSLIRQYLDPEALDGWLDMIEQKLGTKKRGLSFMRTKQVAIRKNGTGREWRRWGSCMLGFGYRSKPHPRLTMHSRTTYLGYVGELDLAVAHVLAREIGKRIGLEPEDIGFTWFIEAAQMHRFKSMAWWFNPEQEKDLEKLLKHKPTKALKARAPGLYYAAKQLEDDRRWDAEGIRYLDMSFSQQVRVRRRYHTEVHGPEYGKQFEGGSRNRATSMAKAAPVLPSIPVSSLTLDPVRELKYTEDDGLDKVGLVGDKNDDVELLD